MRAVFFTAAITSIVAVGLICVFLFANGLPALQEIGLGNFLGGEVWKPNNTPPAFGILPMIVGSLYVTAGAILIGVPIGLLAAIFLARVCPPKPYRILKPAVDLLAGIPSVVYGFFGMYAIVPLTNNKSSILAASILLGIMILPTVIAISESALRAVPEHCYEGALALGAGHYRTVFTVVLPAARSGVLAAAVLGIGRAVGETMAVIMVAGNQARMPAPLLVDGSLLEGGLFKGIRTMTANIVIEMGYASGLHREALIATGVVLFVFILIINLSFSALSRKKT
jgi:phosphate transport system permease protein